MSGWRLLWGGGWSLRRGLRWGLVAACCLAVLVWSAEGVNLSFRELLRGLPWVADLLSRMLPPNPAFLPRLAQPVLETIQIALWGTLLSMLMALSPMVPPCQACGQRFCRWGMSRSQSSSLLGLPSTRMRSTTQLSSPLPHA